MMISRQYSAKPGHVELAEFNINFNVSLTAMRGVKLARVIYVKVKLARVIYVNPGNNKTKQDEY